MSRRRIEIEYVDHKLIVVRGWVRDLLEEVRPTNIRPTYSRRRAGWIESAVFASDIEALAISRNYAVTIKGAPIRQAAEVVPAKSDISDQQAALW